MKNLDKKHYTVSDELQFSLWYVFSRTVYLIQQNAPNANALTAYTAVKRDLQMHRINWRFRQLFFAIP